MKLIEERCATCYHVRSHCMGHVHEWRNMGYELTVWGYFFLIISFMVAGCIAAYMVGSYR